MENAFTVIFEMKRISVTILILLSVLGLFVACSSEQTPNSPIINKPGGGDEDDDDNGDDPDDKPGEVISPWEAGYLDIHAINTGTGDCTFIIMPDGTQMLVDMASTTGSSENKVMWQKPDNLRKPAVYIRRYIERCMEWTGNSTLDYVVLTHWHSDHIGSYSKSNPTGKGGSYTVAGVTDILDNCKVTKVIDRGFSEYDFPYDWKEETIVDNYLKCSEYHRAVDGMKTEIFVPGSRTQITMQRNAAAYGDFVIQNVSVNGTFWDGDDSGSSTYRFIPQSEFLGTGGAAEKCPSENGLSITFRMSYGLFDYYTGGDASNNGEDYFSWKNTENHLAAVVGQVEAMKANHHGSYDACSSSFMSALDPQVIITQTWNNKQPRKETMDRFLTYTRADVFITNLDKTLKGTYSDDALKIIKSDAGHYVIRVAPGGDSYYVYVLEDDDETMTVVDSFGPYRCR